MCEREREKEEWEVTRKGSLEDTEKGGCGVTGANLPLSNQQSKTSDTLFRTLFPRDDGMVMWSTLTHRERRERERKKRGAKKKK